MLSSAPAGLLGRNCLRYKISLPLHFRTNLTDDVKIFLPYSDFRRQQLSRDDKKAKKSDEKVRRSTRKSIEKQTIRFSYDKKSPFYVVIR